MQRDQWKGNVFDSCSTVRFGQERPIVLIGPMLAGKSTIGSLLSRKLSTSLCSLDALCERYYAELPLFQRHNEAVAEKGASNESLLRTLESLAILLGSNFGEYQERLHAHSAMRILEDVHDGVIDFGCGHTQYQNVKLHMLVRRALSGLRNVFAIMPSPSLDRSAAVLFERLRDATSPSCASNGRSHVSGIGPERIRLDIIQSRFSSYTSRFIFTDGVTAAEACDRIALCVNESCCTRVEG